MKNVCIVTASRSEFGHLRNIIDAIKTSNSMKAQIIVTGSHLSPEYGETVNEIVAQGYHIDKTIDMLISSTSKASIAKSMGLCAISISDAYTELKPDIVVVLGDRYELLPICSTALVMGIKIAHISGGYITNGAIDNEIRNAVSMLSDIHFPGTQEAGERLISMGINASRIYVVGTLSTENLLKIPILSKRYLADKFNLDINKKWIMFTFHPETHLDIETNIETLENLIDALIKFDDIQIIASFCNADFGGLEMNKLLVQKASENQGKFQVHKNLGDLFYGNFLRFSYAMVGNSSSGIYESQLYKLPVLNVGKRQEGRYKTANILDCSCKKKDIESAIDAVITGYFQKSIKKIENIYGDGHTSEYIVKYLENYLEFNNLQ